MSQHDEPSTWSDTDMGWWTPARCKLYGRPAPHAASDVPNPPRTATIGEHVDAVLAAKDAEIERLRAAHEREKRERERNWAERNEARDALAIERGLVTLLQADIKRLATDNPIEKLKNLTAGLSCCDDCEQPACVEDGQHDEGPHVLCHDCAVKHKAARGRCGTCRWWQRRFPSAVLESSSQGLCANERSECYSFHPDGMAIDGVRWTADHGCPHHERSAS